MMASLMAVGSPGRTVGCVDCFVNSSTDCAGYDPLGIETAEQIAVSDPEVPIGGLESWSPSFGVGRVGRSSDSVAASHALPSVRELLRGLLIVATCAFLN